MPASWSNYFKFSFTLCLVVVGFIGLYLTTKVILVSLIGIGVGTLLVPPIKMLKRHTYLPRFVGALLIYLVALVVLAGLAFWIGSVVVEQFQSLVEDFPNIKEQITENWAELRDRFPSLERLPQSVETIPWDPQQVTKTLFKGFASVGQIIAGLGFIFIIGFFTALRSDGYFHGFLELIPETKKAIASKLLLRSASALRQWLSAQLIDMTVVAVLTSIGLWIVGVKYWLLLGIFTGVFCFIPYVGIFVSVLFTAFIVAAQSPDQLFWVGVVYLVTQQIEGNLILPYVMRQRLALPEVPLLIMLLLMAKWFGLIGAFLAPPVLAVTSAIIDVMQRPEK